MAGHGYGLAANARRYTAGAALAALALISPLRAWAQAQPTDADGIPLAGSIATNFAANADPDGRRKALASRGITYGLNYVGEWQGNVAGGIKRGAIYIGRLEGLVDMDLEKVYGLKGLSFHANAFWIHGKDLTPDFIGSQMSASFIEAKTTARLSEIWLERKLLGDKAALRVGQLAADTEFAVSSFAAQFINGAFGWPVTASSNLPSGGPAYPFATPGARLKLDPNANATLLVALLNGDPAGPGADDPQHRNRYGLNFRTQDRPLLMTEAQIRANQDKGAAGLAVSFKVGAWNHFGNFDDQRFGVDGKSLADPASNGMAVSHRGDQGYYAVLDQQLWRPASGEPDKGIGAFVRVTGSPSDRNLVETYVDGGLVFAGLWAARPDDVLSVGAAYARISGGARGLDRDAVNFNGSGLVRSAERMLEVNYQAQIAAGWQVDLDVQRIINPSGGVANPLDATGAAIPSATVLTVHTSIKY